jgi:hypothetical protein
MVGIILVWEDSLGNSQLCHTLSFGVHWSSSLSSSCSDNKHI